MLIHSWASFASCSQLKARVSKATKLRSLQGTCSTPCEAACVGTHVSATVQKEGECVFVCGRCLCMQNSVCTVYALGFKRCGERAEVTCEHTFWSQRSWNKAAGSEITLKHRWKLYCVRMWKDQRSFVQEEPPLCNTTVQVYKWTQGLCRSHNSKSDSEEGYVFLYRNSLADCTMSISGVAPVM